MYVMPEWFANHTAVVANISCFITDLQEPYLLLRAYPGMPLFDERFVNYGYNKVQYVEHLRRAGYTFFILNHAFAMDIPHPDSSFRREYIASMHGESLKMKQKFSAFQKMLSTMYSNVSHFPVCAVVKDSYYSDVLFVVC